MAERRCRVCKGWHNLDEPWPAECAGHYGIPHHEGRAHAFALPQVITDAMPPTQSMTNGKVYESKSALRKTYLPSGNPQGQRYIEVGNDRPPPRKPIIDKAGIRRDFQKAAQDYNQGRRAGAAE